MDNQPDLNENLLRKSLIDKIRNNEGLFVEGVNLRREEEPGLFRQLWIEEGAIYGKVQIGDYVRSDDITWSIPVSTVELDEILKIAAIQKFPGMEAKGADIKQVLATVESMLASKLYSDEVGIEIVENLGDPKKNIQILRPSGWSNNDCINEVVHLVETYEMAREWDTSEPSYSLFRKLGSLMSDQGELTHWEIELNLSHGIQGQRKRIEDWMSAMRKEWFDVKTKEDWADKLNARNSKRKVLFEDVIRETLLRSRARPAYENDEVMQANIQLIMDTHDGEGTVTPEDFVGFISNLVESEIWKKREKWIKLSKENFQEVDKVLRNIWARDVVRQQIAFSKDHPRELWCDPAQLEEAKKLVYSSGSMLLKGVTPEMFDAILITPEYVNVVRSSAVDLNQGRELVNNYLRSQNIEEDNLESVDYAVRLASAWLSKIGMQELVGDLRSELKHKLKVLQNNKRGVNDMSENWKYLFEEREYAAIKKFTNLSLVEVPDLLKKVVKDMHLLRELGKVDKTIEDRMEILRLWQRELRIILQEKAFKADRYQVHLSSYLERLPEDNRQLRWSDQAGMDKLKLDRFDIYESLTVLRKLVEELGWRVEDDLPTFLADIVGQAKCADKYCESTQQILSLEIFSKNGARLRDKLGERAEVVVENAELLSISSYEELVRFGHPKPIMGGEPREMVLE